MGQWKLKTTEYQAIPHCSVAHAADAAFPIAQVARYRETQEGYQKLVEASDP
jgi:hypothetical protein